MTIEQDNQPQIMDWMLKIAGSRPEQAININDELLCWLGAELQVMIWSTGQLGLLRKKLSFTLTHLVTMYSLGIYPENRFIIDVVVAKIMASPRRTTLVAWR